VHSSQNTITVIEPGRMRWMGYAAFTRRL